MPMAQGFQAICLRFRYTPSGNKMSKKQTSPTANSKAFIAAAKAAEADTDESRWEARLKAVAKPPAKSVKKSK